MERYPSRNGIAIPLCEVALPSSHLDLENPYSFNNHHKQYYRKQYGRLAIFSTFVNLDRSQEQLPMDVHAFLHVKYDQPLMPTPEQALGAVLDAFEQQELLRFGSANNPKYEPITDRLISSLVQEYGSLS